MYKFMVALIWVFTSGIRISLTSHTHDDPHHVKPDGTKTKVFFIPSLKSGAKIADVLFAQEHFRYGLGKSGNNTIKEVLDDHDLVVSKSRSEFSWMESLSNDYEAGIKKIALISDLHRNLLFVSHGKIQPDDVLERWTEEVLSSSEKGLVWALAFLDKLIQGHSSEKSTSIVKIFRRNAKPLTGSSSCLQVHDYRDYLLEVQMQGYAMLSTALNVVNQHAGVHVLLKLALQRFREQEEILGGRFNDWYNYGQGSCNSRIQFINDQSKCIRLQHLNYDSDPKVYLGECETSEPQSEEQWLYNKISWQIVPRWNQSFCLQTSHSTYNNGIQIVLRKCKDSYDQKWLVDSAAGQIKLFSNPYKCLTQRSEELVLWTCSNSSCTNCDDRWGDNHFNLHEKLNVVMKSIYGDLNLVTWLGLEV